ncbi:outer membrane beta-barrel protein [Spirochaetota bacterium]
MKTFRLVILLSIIIALPPDSYADFDISIYGGYSYFNKIEDLKPRGFEYGLNAHFKKDILPMILSIGIGAFAHFSPLKDKEGTKYDKKTFGLDGNLQLELPIIIHPYAKASVAIWEEVKGDFSNTDYFNSYYFGGGIAFSILSFLHLYIEYLHNTALENTNKAEMNSFLFGLRFVI